MVHAVRKQQFLDLSLLVVATGFAWILHVLEVDAAASRRWNVLVFPPLGPFSEVAALFVNLILPAIPFLFVSVIAIRHARDSSAFYRTILIVSVIVLGILSFWELAWVAWLVLAIISQGGRF
jgi:hypothetical protein